ncbi:hypothetical protein Tco_0645978 [Tanacetum coccineum]
MSESVRGSRGVSSSAAYEECLPRRLSRNVSIGGSRGTSPLEAHEECLRRRPTRSVSLGGSRGTSPSEALEERHHWRLTRKVSIGGSRRTYPSKAHEERLHRRLTRNVSIGGSRGMSPSEAHEERLHRSVDVLPTIAPAEAPQTRNHVKSPRTQDTNTKDAPSDRGPEGVTEGSPMMGDKIGKELLHFAPCPYYMHILMMKISHEGEMNLRIEHLSAELAKLKGANHALKKANHSRWKKYKKYKAEREFLVLEKEKLENELLEILAASKQDKESFAKGKSQLDLQETELEDLKHQPSIEQSETHKLKNAIIENERDLFEDSFKRTSRDLFENSSRVASLPKHLLVSSPWQLVPTLNEGCIFPSHDIMCTVSHAFMIIHSPYMYVAPFHSVCAYRSSVRVSGVAHYVPTQHMC